MRVGVQITEIPTLALHPTQGSIGFREVTRKRDEWRARVGEYGAALHPHHVIPTVLGPARRHYAIDRHHFARAMHDEGVGTLAVKVVADASALPETEFWQFLAARSWGHPFDSDGRPLTYALMPLSVADMTDDPYRGLAGALRRAGGYAKDAAPCSEFAWADFLRSRIDAQMLRDDFEATLGHAMRLCQDRDGAVAAPRA